MPRLLRTLAVGGSPARRALLPSFLLTACAAPVPRWTASPWPEADLLFRQDPRWRGGDAAYSIDLGSGRTLWLFGDSFVARPGARGRAGCAMPRNTIALQEGKDPSHATLTFRWRGGEQTPSSFFPEDGDVWHWPLHGIRLGDAVTVLCTRVRATGEPGPFGFRAVGFAAFRITGIDAPVAQWQLARIPVPAVPFPVVVGQAIVAEGEHILAFALREPGDHALLLLRWQRGAFAAGDLAAPEWYDAGHWRPHTATQAAPAAILAEGAPELSVSPDPRGGWIMVHSLGFGATDLVARHAQRPQGPWSPPELLLRPPESDLPGVLVYAGKAHPQLAGADLVATYASNAFDFHRLAGDTALYYPRCVRLWRR